MSEPLGRTFSVKVNDKQRTFTIGPDVLNTKVARSLLLLKKERLESSLKAVQGMKSSLREDDYFDKTNKLADAILSCSQDQDFTVAYEMLSDIEALSHVLAHGCPEIVNMEDAVNVLDALDNPVALLTAVGEVVNETMESVNSSLGLEETE